MSDKTEGLAQARAERSARKRRAVEDALSQLQAQGEVITFKRLAEVANVSRVYLYDNFKEQIEKIRSQSRGGSVKVDGVTVPKRTQDESTHVEAVLRNKLDRMKSELSELRKENARLKQALEKERGKSEHFRQNWINASQRQSG